VIRDLTTGANVLKFGYKGWANATVTSFDGNRLVSLYGEVVKIWQTNNANENQDIADHHPREMNCVSFSGDGQLVASGSEDITLKIWDTLTGQCLTTFRGHSRRVGLGCILLSRFDLMCVLGIQWSYTDMECPDW
jgi:WD40 repeat protein